MREELVDVSSVAEKEDKPKFQRILFPTDFSAASEIALKYAEFFAKSFEAELQILFVLDAQDLKRRSFATESRAVIMEAAEKRGSQIVTKLTDAGIKAMNILLEGNASLEILRYARDNNVDLVITTSRVRSSFDEAFYGSTCMNVLRRASCPVLIVKYRERSRSLDWEPQIKRVLWPTDFSAHSRSIVPYAAAICKRLGAKLVAEHVIDTSQQAFRSETATSAQYAKQQALVPEAAHRKLQEILTSKEFEEIDSKPVALAGMSVETIVEAVVRFNIDLITMSTLESSESPTSIMGSVTERVIQKSPVPVLALRCTSSSFAT